MKNGDSPPMEPSPRPGAGVEVAGMMVDVGVKGELRLLPTIVPVALEEVEVLVGSPNAILDS